MVISSNIMNYLYKCKPTFWRCAGKLKIDGTAPSRRRTICPVLSMASSVKCWLHRTVCGVAEKPSFRRAVSQIFLSLASEGNLENKLHTNITCKTFTKCISQLYLKHDSTIRVSFMCHWYYMYKYVYFMSTFFCLPEMSSLNEFFISILKMIFFFCYKMYLFITLSYSEVQWVEHLWNHTKV